MPRTITLTLTNPQRDALLDALNTVQTGITQQANHNSAARLRTLTQLISAITDAWDREQATTPARTARCSCGKTKPSDTEHLAFFQDLGDGSRAALEHCGTCGFHLEAHLPARPGVIRNKTAAVCGTFTPHGEYPQDSFYCGCRGWD